MSRTPTGREGTPDWEAVRISLEVVRRGSFRAAAEHLRMSVNTVRRRVDELERSLGFILFNRHVDGIVAFTPEGEKFVAAVSNPDAWLKEPSDADGEICGEVRLSVPEELLGVWMAPRLIELERPNPDLTINVNGAMRPANLFRRAPSVVIQMMRPATSNLRSVKLGRLHFLPFAAPAYLEVHGKPGNVDDLQRHRILMQTADATRWPEAYRLLPPTVFRTASMHYYRSIAAGGGIGLLPTYAKFWGAKIVPLDFGLRPTADIWLTYHPDARRFARVSRLIEWAISAFSPRTYPWFRDHFIHPDDLKAIYRGEPLPALFGGLAAGAVRENSTSRITIALRGALKMFLGTYDQQPPSPDNSPAGRPGLTENDA